VAAIGAHVSVYQ